MKTQRQIIEKKLDIIRSKIIRSIWKCEYCWKTDKRLNAHHIWWRKKKITRRDLDNWISLCAYHHVFSHEFSAHQTPTEFTEWVKWYRWEKRYNHLREKAYQIKQYKVRELEELYEELVLKLNK